MTWIFLILGLVLVVVIGLVVLGRETARLADVGRPAVFDMTEAIDFIADRLPEATQARISHDDVRWILLADADLLEEATSERPADGAATKADEHSDEIEDTGEIEGTGEVGDAAADEDGGDTVDDGEPAPDDRQIVDEDAAVARILQRADESDRGLADEDIVAVLDGRLAYLEAIGAIGPQADE